jgi:hypothetical protein
VKLVVSLLDFEDGGGRFENRGVEIVGRAVFMPRRKVAQRKAPNWTWVKDSIVISTKEERLQLV